MEKRIHKFLDHDELQKIKNSTKKAHCELKKGEFSNVKCDDIITFFDETGNKCDVLVLAVLNYHSFREFLENHINSTDPYSLDIDEELKRYNPDNSQTISRDEERYHVIGVYFNVLKEFKTPDRRRNQEFYS